MEPFAAVLSGGGAGLLGAALAHVLTVLCARLGSAAWLKGPYGPPFFDLALSTGLLYGAIGAAAGRRAAVALAAFLGAFLGVILPMCALTRWAPWGLPRESEGMMPQWQLAVLTVYVLALWGTIAGIGAASAATKPWRGALAAALGSLPVYGAMTLIPVLLPGYDSGRWNPLGWLPSPLNLLDGLLSGAGLCLALSLDQRLARRPS